MNGQNLLESIAQGDLAGFENAYLSYRDEFIMWANKNYYCDFEESRDIYQATVIQFYENVRSGRLTHLTSDLKTYLFAIGKNKIREQREAGRKFRDMPKITAQVPMAAKCEMVRFLRSFIMHLLWQNLNFLY